MINSLTIEISQPQLIINTILRLITAFIFLRYIIPLQIKEANVKNGLLILRRELLISGVMLLLINSLGLCIILLRYFVGDTIARIVSEVVTLFNSLGLFAVGLIKYQIYHQEYTPENKKKHDRIYELEQAEH